MNATIVTFKMTRKIGQFHRMRKICTLINLLSCSAAYLVISEIVKKISREREFAKSFLNIFMQRYHRIINKFTSEPVYQTVRRRGN